MNKYIIILLLLMLSGCKTFTQKDLLINNRKHFKKGYDVGFYHGRFYQELIHLEDILDGIK